MVTTKQGESGKIRISYDGYIGWQNMQRFPDVLNAKEYVDMVELITFNTGDRVLNWKEILGDRYESIMSGDDKGTNWLDAIRQKNAPINNHAINIAGGSERSRFSIGVSYSSQNGILGKPVESHYEHTTARLNSEHVLLKLGNRDIVKLGENLFYSYSSQNGILGKPVESHYEHTTARLNSEHVLLKLGNRDIVKLGENLFYSYEFIL